MALTDKLTNIADAIREKTGSTDTMNLEGMVNAINAIQTGGGGTTDHSKLENRDAADQHPISAITGLEEALTPLVGTTQTITPSQVLAAIKAGRDIALQYTDSDLGSFVFSAFNANEQKGIVVSNSILPEQDELMGTLMGIVKLREWNFSTTNMATKDDVGTAVNEALAVAKESGEFDGADGLTPTIGDNGNWYLGDTDTGKPSRGDKGDKGDKGDTGETGATGATGAAGKSAYEYAQDGGYTGTEAEFAEKLAQEMPTTLPNPNALTFTGAVTGSYDGSAPMKVEIPSGGGGSGGNPEWAEVVNTTLEEAATLVTDEYPDATEVIVKMAIPVSPTGEEVSTGTQGMTFFGAPLYHVKIIDGTYGTLLHAHIIKSNGTAAGISIVLTTTSKTPTFNTVARANTAPILVKDNIGAAGATPFSCSIELPAGTIIQISVR